MCSSDLKCTDINECAKDNGGCDPKRKCINAPGTRRCGDCPKDMLKDGFTGCRKINLQCPAAVLAANGYWSDATKWVYKQVPTESDLVVITNKDVNVKKDGDASNIILTGSSITITDATLSVSDVKMTDVCVKGNECNPQDIIAAGQKAGVVVKRVGSSLAYDMVDNVARSANTALAGVQIACKPGFENPKGPTHLKCSSTAKFASFDFSKFQCKAAETCSAAENQQQGAWADPKTWRGNGVPSSLDAVHISDKPVNVQKDAEAQGLVIEGSMASLFVLDGSVTVGEDDPACSQELCNMEDLVVGSGLTKKLYGRMLFEGKRGLLSLVDPSSAKSDRKSVV